MKKYCLAVCSLLLSVLIQAQSNFSFSPEKPKPGDVVTFRYEAPSSVFSSSDVINCMVNKWGTYIDETEQSQTRDYKPIAIVLKKNGNYYEGTVITDSSTRVLAFSFTSADVKWKRSGSDLQLVAGKADNNGNEGYFIPFYTADGNPYRFSHLMRGKYLSNNFYNGLGIKNSAKATEYFLKELQLFPGSKYQVFPLLRDSYAAMQQPDKYRSMAAKEMENLFAAGLQSEKDIKFMRDLSLNLGFMQQGYYFARLANERSKAVSGLVSRYNEFNTEADLAKRENILEDITMRYNKLGYEQRQEFMAPVLLHQSFLFALVTAKKPDQFATYADKYNFLEGNIPSSIDDLLRFKRMFDELITQDLAITEKFVMERYNIYSGQLSKFIKGAPLPATAADEYYTAKDKASEMTTAAAIFADMAAQIYSKKGDDKKAWKYATEAMQYITMPINEYFRTDEITIRYAVLAEKFLPASQCKAEIEKLIKAGTWKPEMVDVLKRLWVKEKKSEKGFEEYWNSFRQETVTEVKKTLLATQVNYPAPQFVLKDMEGKEVSLESLKGKIVVLDFWATWCAPCKASFPGMQKMVNYYKNNPNVEFLFVDTWETKHDPANGTDEKKLQAVADFISSKKYSFHVLMDNASTVVKDFKVEGIPTKFIIDKNGNVRYKVLGAELDEGKLFDEMTAMIESVK